MTKNSRKIVLTYLRKEKEKQFEEYHTLTHQQT